MVIAFQPFFIICC